MNHETEKLFQNSKHCHICEKLFTNEDIKVRDHVHVGIQGDASACDYSNYRGAVCQSCNLN